jgi:hypothetical protein
MQTKLERGVGYMKTLIKINGIIKIATAMVVILLFGFSIQAQAANSSAPFDHTQTGFILKDVHRTLKCEQCHVDGIFKNTPKNCAGCHAIGTRVGATPQPINHVQTTAACETCHTSSANFQVKSFNHLSVAGNCSSCHNSQSLGVLSKPAGTHIPTTQPCELCHTNTSTFASWQMGSTGHTGITSNCFSCHGGPAGEPGVVGTYPGVVSYNPANHIPITTSSGFTPDCNACHSNFNTFLGATYNHAGVSFSPGANSTPSCSGCHSGQMPNVTHVPPIPANHISIPAGNDCSVCHSNTVSFLGALYNHNSVTTGSCDTCHTGAYPGVMTKGASHIPTLSYKCDSCHTSLNTVGYTTFAGSTYHGSGLPVTAGTCNTCHSGAYAASPELAQGATSGTSGIHIPLSGSQTCDLCHTAANTNQFMAFSGAHYHTSVTATAGSCNSCHNGTYNTGEWTAQGLNAVSTHIPTSGASCDVCHTAANTAQYTSFQGTTYHKSVTASAGSCVTCHSATYPGIYTSSNAHSVGTTHIPISGASCDVCHTASNTLQYSVSYDFAGATYHSSVTAIPGGCNGCHSGAYLAAPENAQSIASGSLTMGTPHIGTNNASCDSCHTQTLSSNYTTFLGALFDHTQVSPAVAGRCSTCHNGVNAKGQGAGHISTGWASGAGGGTTCDSAGCHTPATTNNYTTFLGGTVHPATAIAAGSCANSTCHDGSVAGLANFAIAKPAAHPTTAITQCDSANGCHANSTYITWAGTKYHPNGAVSGGCAQSNCHAGTRWGNAQAIASSHPISQAPALSCDSASGCHSSVAPSYTTWSGTQYHPNGSVTGGCDQSNCHQPAKLWGTALAKPAGHPPVGAITTCDAAGGCHSTVAPSYVNWAGTKYHPNGSVTGGCAQSNCHTGSPLWGGALGTNTGHVTYTAQDCGTTCHTIATTSNYTNWLGASYAHDANAVGKCQQCHDGVQANGQSKPHITASGSCDASGCHTGATIYGAANVNIGYPGAWAGAVYAHANPPGTCSTCHGISASVFPNVSTQTYCYNPSTTVCPSPSPYTHQSTSAKCDSCHTSTTTWAGAGFGHTTTLAAPAGAPAGSCLYSGCHGVGGTAKTMASYPNHISGSIIPSDMSCDNSGCHKVWNGTTVTTFAGGMLPHSLFTTMRCDACHGVYPTFGTFGALGKVSNHIPTTMSAGVMSSTGAGDCNVCHIKGGASIAPTGAATSGSAAWSTETVGATAHGCATGGGTCGVYCVTCHLSSATYLASKIQKFSHNKSSTTTDCSKSGCHKPLGSKGTAFTKWN